MADFTVEGIITVDSSKAIRDLTKFQTKLKSVSKDLRELDKEIDRIDGRNINITATLDTKKYKSEAAKLRKDIEELDGKGIDLSAGLSTGKIGAEIEKVRKQIEEIDKQHAEAKIGVNAKKAEVELAKVEAQLQAIEDKKTVSKVTVDTKRAIFDTALIRNQIAELDKQKATIQVNVETQKADLEIAKVAAGMQLLEDKVVRSQIEVDTKEAQRDIALTKKELSDLAREKASISVDADIRTAAAKLKEITAEIDDLKSRHINVGIDLDDPTAQAAKLNAEIAALSSDDINLDVKLKGATKVLAEAKALHAELQAIERPVEIPVKYDRKPLRELFNDVEMARGGIGGPGMGTGTLVGAIAAIAPALAPLGAVSAGVLGGFASSVAVATSGVSAFGVVAIPTIKKIADGIKLLNTDTSQMDPSQLAEYNKKVEDFKKTNPLIQKAVDNFAKLKKSYMDLNKQIEPKVLEIFNNGLKVGNTLLQSLSPMVTRAGDALADLSAEMAQAFKGDDWQKFFKFLNNNVKQFILDWGRATGNFITGIANMIRAFGPLAKWFNKGMLGMSRDFKKWSEGLKNSEGFQKFVDYVKQNGPLVADLLGSIIDAIIQLGIAFAPLGTKIIVGATKVFDAITNFAKQHPKVTAMGVAIGGLTAALAPLAGPLTSVAGPLIGLLGGITGSAAAAAGIVALAAGFAALGGALAFLNKDTKNYKPMMDSLKQTWEDFQGQLAEVKQTVIDFWNTLNSSSAPDNFQQGIKDISDTLQILMPYIGPAAKLIGGVLVGSLILAATNFRMLAAAIKTVASYVDSYVHMIAAPFIWLYDTLIGHSIIPDLVNGIHKWFQKLIGFMLDPVRTIRGAIVAIFSAIKGKVLSIVSSMVGAIKDRFSNAKSAVSDKVSAIRGAVTSGFSAVLAAVRSKVTQVPGIARTAFNNAKQAVTTATSAIVTTARSKFQDVVSSAKRILGQVKGAVTGAFAGAGSWLIHAGEELVGGLITGLGNRLDDVRAKAAEIANAVKGLFPGSPVKEGPLKSWNNGGAGKRLMKMLADGIDAGSKYVEAAARRVAKKTNDAATPKNNKSPFAGLIASLVSDLSKGESKIRGELSSISSAIAAFYKKKYKDSKVADAFTKSAMKLLKNQYDNIIDVSKAYDRYAEKAQKALDRVNALKQAQKEYAQSIQASVVALGNVTQIGQDENGNVTAGSITGALDKQVADAKRFAKLIRKLRKMGLNKQSIQDLLNAGVSGGLAAAQALVDGGSGTISKVNNDMKQLNQIGKSLGTDAGHWMYDAGIEAAKGVLHGLRLQEKALQKYMRMLGQNLAHSLAIVLSGQKDKKNKIKHQITGSMDHVNQNGDKKHHHGKGPKGGGDDGNGGKHTERKYEITVKAGVPSAEVGRQVVKAIEAFEKSGGRKKK